MDNTNIFAMQHKGAALLLKMDKMVLDFRRQNYYTALAMTKIVIDELVLYIDAVCSTDFSEYGIDAAEECGTISTYLGEILKAQEALDYILTADLYEIGIIPALTGIQSKFAAINGNIINSNIKAALDALDKRGLCELAGYLRNKADSFSEEAAGICIEPAADGEYTAAVVQGNTRIYLHSNNKPSLEGYNQALYYDNNSKEYYIYGLGLGYMPKEMLELCSYSKVTVYESSREIILAALLYGVLPELLENAGFELVYDKDFSKLANDIKTKEFIVHKPSLALISNSSVRRELEEYFVQYNSIKSQKRELEGNFDLNIASYDAGADELRSVISGKNVYIIAAGPSLDKNINIIKNIKRDKSQNIILCAGTVYKKLLNAGIEPDFVMVTDAKKNTYSQIEGIEDKTIPLIGLSTLYFGFFKNYSGKKYIVFQNGFDKAERYAKEKGFTTFETGGSVMTTAFDMAVRLGAKRIIFVGLDLAYTGGYNHAKDTQHYKQVDLKNVLYVEGNYEKSVPTGVTLNIYREWFEKRLMQPDVPEVINATEGGARIKGMKLMTLSDAIGEEGKLKRYLLVKGESQYDAMRIYIDEIAGAINELGGEAVIVDGTAKDAAELFEAAVKNNHFEAVITCNGILLSEVILKMIDTSFCTLIFDQPVRHNERISQADKNTLVITCDRNHTGYVKKYYPNVGKTGFLPLSGSYTKDIKPYEERSIDLLFTGSYLDFNKVYGNIKQHPKLVFDIEKEVIEYIISNPSNTCETAFSHILKNRGVTVSLEEFHQFMNALRDVELYMRGYFRNEVISTILNSGIRLDVFGSGWDKFSSSGKKNMVLHEGYAETSLKALADTKISLNVMPWFKGGFQERIASAMLCGAVALTDTSTYIEENFTSGKELVTYNLEHIEKLPEIIEGLLKSTVSGTEGSMYCAGGVLNAQEIAGNGRNAALAGHTWKHRTKELLKMIDEFNTSRGK